VHVAVDQAGHQHAAGRIDHSRASRRQGPVADRANRVAVDPHETVLQQAARDGIKYISVVEENHRHERVSADGRFEGRPYSACRMERRKPSVLLSGETLAQSERGGVIAQRGVAKFA